MSVIVEGPIVVAGSLILTKEEAESADWKAMKRAKAENLAASFVDALEEEARKRGWVK